MTHLLDTNVCIAAMRGNPKVVQELAARSPEDCAVSCGIDDLYQSGVTAWSLAKFLKTNGARGVYALACVKSWSDTDNL